MKNRSDQSLLLIHVERLLKLLDLSDCTVVVAQLSRFMADLVRGRENRVHWVRIGHQLIHEGITVLILGVHQGGCGGLQPNT